VIPKTSMSPSLYSPESPKRRTRTGSADSSALPLAVAEM
jgi:hypothetical protein